MSNQTLIDTDQLKTLTGYCRPGDIENWLRKNDIRFFSGKNGPITTTDSINSALGLQPKTADTTQEFDFI
jgi:hypothetical protein